MIHKPRTDRLGLSAHLATLRRRAPRALPWLAVPLAALLGWAAVKRTGAIASVIPPVALWMLLVGTVRLFTARDSPSRRRLTNWTLGAFAVHFLIGYVIWSRPSLTQTFGGDAVTYNTGGVALASHWLGGTPSPHLPPGKEGFYFLLAAVYWIFGPHPTTGLFVDAFLAAATVPVLYDATRRLFGEDAARTIPVLATLIPGFLLWGSQLLREAGVYFLTAVCLNAATRLRDRTTLSSMLAFVIGAALLAAWRADVGLLVAGGLVIGLMIARPVGGAVTGTTVLALGALVVVGAGLGYSGYQLIIHSNLATLGQVRTGSSVGAASGFLPNADVSTPRHAAGYLPLGFTYFVLGPFPWQLHAGRQLLAIPDTLTWWFLLPILWRGLRRAKGLGRAVWLSLVPSLSLALVLSLFVANFGTTVRERMQAVLLLLPVAAYGWTQRSGSSPAQGHASRPSLVNQR